MKNGTKQVQVARFGLIFCHKRSVRLWEAYGMPPGPPKTAINSRKCWALGPHGAAAWPSRTCYTSTQQMQNNSALGPLCNKCNLPHSHQTRPCQQTNPSQQTNPPQTSPKPEHLDLCMFFGPSGG